MFCARARDFWWLRFFGCSYSSMTPFLLNADELDEQLLSGKWLEVHGGCVLVEGWMFCH